VAALDSFPLDELGRLLRSQPTLARSDEQLVAQVLRDL
jgi:hypothetical protein